MTYIKRLIQIFLNAIMLSLATGIIFISFEPMKETIFLIGNNLSTYLGAKTDEFATRERALDALTSAARQHKIPPKLLLAISKIETAGTFSVSIRPRRKNGTVIGTARGLCQFLKSTADAYRLDWSSNNPKEQANACAKLLIDNSRYLKKKLRRRPKFSEIYLAHVFGAGRAYRIIKAPANQSVQKTIGLRALRANEFLRSQKNANGIRMWADRKMRHSIKAVKQHL